MEKRSNLTKILVVVLLFVVLAAVAAFMFMRSRPQPAKPTPPPATTQAEQAAPQPEAPAEKPALPLEAEPVAPAPEGAAHEAEKPVEAPAVPTEPAPPAPAAGEKPEKAPPPAAGPKPPPEAKPAPEAAPPAEPAAPAKRPERKQELPKISFMDEEVDEQFRESRFFVMNDVVPSKNPFVPMKTFVPPRSLGGKPEQLGPGFSPGGTLTGGDNGEIPLLPLPGETLGDVIPIKLIGVSTGSQSATALFEVDGEVMLYHPGWLVGSDYVFVGAQFGKANLFNRKSNRIIQLASGETL
jgi:hypothetical protein